MKIGYLMNTYPVTSGTFIRREIRALEAGGAEVMRYAVRRWDQALVDPADREEAAQTHYLLSGRTGGLIGDFLGMFWRNPAGVMRAFGLWRRLIANSGGGLVRHTAYLMEAATLCRLAARDGIAHLHCHFSTNPAAVAMLARAMGGPGYSFTAHGPDEFLEAGPGSLGLKIAQADFVVAISHFCRGTLTLAAELAGIKGAWEKIHIVRCGLDLGDFPVSGAGFETPEIVCVGRLCPQKGQVLIPAAVADVAKTHPEIRVVLIGDGESREAIEAEIARLGLETQIELAGWASNADVRARVGQARALLLPSFAEGLPIVIMEALALGRPVITTYIAGIPELVDAGCGWILPAGDEAALARALGEAMAASPQDLAARGAEGRARIEARHDQIANAAVLRALIAETTGAHG